MSERLRLRRHLYERMERTRRLSRTRRALRRQVAVLATADDGPDGGAAGVREPRRPSPGEGPAGASRPGG